MQKNVSYLGIIRDGFVRHVLSFGPCLFEKRERESWRSMAEGAMIPSNWRREARAWGGGYFSGPFLRCLSSGRSWILASNVTRCLSSASSRLSPMTASLRLTRQVSTFSPILKDPCFLRSQLMKLQFGVAHLRIVPLFFNWTLNWKKLKR